MAAPRVSDDPAVERHYAAQTALSVALVIAVRRLWPILDLTNLKTTMPQYRQAMTAVVQHFGSASASLSAEHYSAMRANAGVPGSFRVAPLDPVPVEKIDASTGWATADLWDSRFLDPNPVITPDFDPTVIIENTQTKVEGAAQKNVLDAGRDQIMEAVTADRKARGWVRVARPDACAFCLMLATRGVTRGSTIYRSQQTASFEAHNTCHCTAEPVFGIYEAPAHIRAAAALYEKSTTDVGDKLNAFRRALDAQRRGA